MGLRKDELREMDIKAAEDAAWIRATGAPRGEYAWVDRGYAACVAQDVQRNTTKESEMGQVAVTEKKTQEPGKKAVDWERTEAQKLFAEVISQSDCPPSLKANLTGTLSKWTTGRYGTKTYKEAHSEYRGLLKGFQKWLDEQHHVSEAAKKPKEPTLKELEITYCLNQSSHNAVQYARKAAAESGKNPQDCLPPGWYVFPVLKGHRGRLPGDDLTFLCDETGGSQSWYIKKMH